METAGPREQTVRGVLFPAKREINNQTVRLLIDTTEQDAYLIRPSKKGNELDDFVHREVEITGTVKETDEGDFIFEVKAYRLLGDIDQEKASVA